MHKLALIGYGYWGKRLLGYLEEQFDVAYICHRNASESKRFTSSIEKALNGDIEAVVIATPIDTHYEIAKRVLQYDKHILCEKPLAQSYREACEIAEIASEKNLCVVTEFTYTFSNGIQQARKLIRDGGIGELLSMELSLKYLGRFIKFNVYWLLASHLLAVWNMFAPLENSDFTLVEQVKDETGIILVKGCVPGCIRVSLNYPQRETQAIWYGTEGTIVYDGINQPALSVVKYKKKHGALSNEMIDNIQYFHHDEQNNLRNAVAWFASILDNTNDLGRNLQTSLAVTRILAAIKSNTNKGVTYVGTVTPGFIH